MPERIRKLLPGPVRRFLGRSVPAHRARRLGRLSVPEAFDDIYWKACWKQVADDNAHQPGLTRSLLDRVRPAAG